MSYQEAYGRYQRSVKLRELSRNEAFAELKDTFYSRILSNIVPGVDGKIVQYLAGIREVFEYVDAEAQRVDGYREEVDRFFASGEH